MLKANLSVSRYVQIYSKASSVLHSVEHLSNKLYLKAYVHLKLTFFVRIKHICSVSICFRKRPITTQIDINDGLNIVISKAKHGNL